ncbi:uncharacterized protein LOC110844441 [Folsomia candida]|uniref:uncharacterized protein LOC110844441 n=1 Tax=Folsomia candida TaxID=158441 RepID=UPI000B8F0A52|nr:uncharacterized protein LOC110844441 [Folsomia candida]
MAPSYSKNIVTNPTIVPDLQGKFPCFFPKCPWTFESHIRAITHVAQAHLKEKIDNVGEGEVVELSAESSTKSSDIRLEEEEELELLAEVMDNAWADLKNPPKISIVIVPPKSTPKYQPRFEPTPLWKIPPLMRRSYKRTFRKVMK